ncbi:MAG TPA: hypothetical protein VLV48_07415 [Thermoanaerobaculia bacterium]|nr:hypothetical protein [Thermoanaerobaculia bacterium]
MKASERPGAPARGIVDLQPGELGGLLLQSLLLAGSMGFAVAVILSQATALSRPIAFGIGLEAGLLSSYPTMRLVARANRSVLGFGKWAAITLVPATLGVTILLIV